MNFILKGQLEGINNLTFTGSVNFAGQKKFAYQEPINNCVNFALLNESGSIIITLENDSNEVLLAKAHYNVE